MRKLNVYFAVWGHDYVKLLVNLTLPSYLFENNLKKVAKEFQTTVSIFTDQESKALILKSSIIPELKKVCDLEINCCLDNLEKKEDKFETCSLLHEAIIKDGLKKELIGVIACPDVVIGNGSLEYALKKLGKNKKLVTYPSCVRTHRELAAPMIEAKINEGFALTNSDLLSIGLEHLHPYSKAHFLGTNQSNAWSSSLLYKVDDRFFLGKTYFFHPYILDFCGKSLLYSIKDSRIDGNVFHALGFKPKELYVIKDSLHFGAVELAPKDEPITRTVKHATLPKSKQLFESLKLGMKLPSYYLPLYFKHTFIFRDRSKSIPFHKRILYKTLLLPNIIFLWCRFHIGSKRSFRSN